MLESFQVHRRLKPYVEVVTDHEFGLQRIPAMLSTPPRGATQSWENGGTDRFSIILPYASQKLKWEIIFDCHNLMTPPDVIAEVGFFESISPDIVKETVPSLGDWRPSDVNCLLNFILELLNLHQASQIEVLKNSENLQRYYFEYNTLVSMGIIATSDLEVSVQPSARGTTVEFGMALKLDVSDLPVTPVDSTRPVAILTVTYRTQSETSVQLSIWSELEDLIGTTVLPTLEKSDALFDYVLDVVQVLQEKIKKVRDGLRQKQYIFCALTSLLEPSLLDADSELYTKVSFLLEHDKHQAICTIDIPDGYPARKPIPTLYKIKMNVRNFDSGAKVSMMELNYPYDKEWDATRIAQAIVNAVRQEVFRLRSADA